MYISNSVVNIINSSFTGNQASNYGGAIYCNKWYVQSINSVYNDGSATILQIPSGTSATLSNIIVTNCTSTYNSLIISNGDLSVSYSQFSNNHVQNGIIYSQAQVTIQVLF